MMSSGSLSLSEVPDGPKKPSRFSFSRPGRPKGTEHLEQAVRKSADQRVNHSQRYIILPSSRRTSANSPTQECILTRDPVPEPDTHILLPQPLAPPRPRSRHPGTSADHPSSSSSSTSSNNNVNNNNNISSNVSSSISSNNWSGGFINKPPRGWLHPDHKITSLGVEYNVKYVGCLQINTSMRSLDFETRSLIAKECIARVCESAGLRESETARPTEPRVVKMLAESPNLSQTGSEVKLSITSASLNLTVIETREVIARHEMPNISFASGGDTDMADFVAYVAKDSLRGRACFVLDCTGGLAQDVISTIGQAFELRFKEFLKRSPGRQENARIADVERDYYNDLPGKVPPDVQPSSSSHLSHPSLEADGARQPHAAPRLKTDPICNLIDLNADLISRDESREYVNCDLHPDEASILKDPFDMQPFNSTLEELTLRSEQLEEEEWFHGAISRKESEELVQEDGDFLVRESVGCKGQFVLTGRHGGVCKHLLLVDPDGVVRTKDRSFDSVCHLVHYHQHNSLPIISAESSLRLKRAVVSKTS